MSQYEWKSLVRDNKQQQSIKDKKLPKKWKNTFGRYIMRISFPCKHKIPVMYQKITDSAIKSKL